MTRQIERCSRAVYRPDPDVPIELVVEFARLNLPLGKIVALGEGDVVTLDRPLAEPVTLRANGKLIAKGELVDVEGEAGVRLVEVYA